MSWAPVIRVEQQYVAGSKPDPQTALIRKHSARRLYQERLNAIKAAAGEVDVTSSITAKVAAAIAAKIDELEQVIKAALAT